jgi:hypothetical protein
MVETKLPKINQQAINKWVIKVDYLIDLSFFN